MDSLRRNGAEVVAVVAPVPWFPLGHACFGRYGVFARVPRREDRQGVVVHHPRYPVIPKVGMSLAPFLLAAAVAPFLSRLRRQGCGFDLIDAHYFYPDGVAAALLGRLLNVPVVVTSRGSDLNAIAGYAAPRHLIRWAAGQAAALVTISMDLRQRLVRLGVPEAKVRVVRNGVDWEHFHPPEVSPAPRSPLSGAGSPGPGDRPLALLCMGNLVPHKGTDLVIRALPALPRAALTIVGEGPEREKLEGLARELGVAGRVRFVGEVAPEETWRFHAEADLLVVASTREGIPNVIYESLACGTPVVATAVGGISEVLTHPAAGVLMTERTPEALVEALTRLGESRPGREVTREFSRRFSWDESSRELASLFEAVCKRRSSPPGGGAAGR
ncbi:MAG: glycosyltransferase [Magnetococcales bacterium]|nr:glycosyltransferase [Magnetococcales bacterium]MBF0156548.1 glycosyltransferase [Magnetococcales bacterium]